MTHFFLSKLPRVRAASFCLTLAAFLAGCASSNPKPDAAGGKPATPAAATPAAATSGTAPVAGADVEINTVGLSTLQRALWFISPYRITIQQGNFVSHEMIAPLKDGMTREQVKFALGTPLLMDAFHADRWDYPFRLQKGSGELTSSHVTIHFKDDKVVKIEGGNLPNEQDYIARIAGPMQAAEHLHEKEEQKGLINFPTSK